MSSSKLTDEIVITAPGKVILHGEHSVVYGKIAVAASLNLRTKLKLKTGSENKICLSLPDIDVNVSWDLENIKEKLSGVLSSSKPTEPCSSSEELFAVLKSLAGVGDNASTKSLALVAFLYLYCCICESLPPLDLHVASSLPTSAGLGSSAAYSVCLATSLLVHSGVIPPSQQIGDSSGWSETHIKLINDWAFQAEVVIHGKPSGIDNSVSTYGGALIFQQGVITPLKRVPTLRIMLTNTKVPRSTKVLVAGVREKYDKYTSIMSPILDAMEALAETAVKTFEDDSSSQSDITATFEDLVDMNQHLLRLIGVGHQCLDQICEVTQKHGLHSKLTGAGGGGCAFTILPTDISRSLVDTVQQDLISLGFDCWETSVGGPGVTQHFSDAES